MVRFIKPSNISKTMPGTLIYIPIWLDLLMIYEKDRKIKELDLHSNMVRFINYLDSRSIRVK